MSRVERTLATLTLPRALVDSVAPGATRCLSVEGGSVIAHRSRDGQLTVAPNGCQHMLDAFAENADIEDAVLVCPHHGARLDCSTMTYTADAKLNGMITVKKMTGDKHPVYLCRANADGSVSLTLPPGAAPTALGALVASLAPRSPASKGLFFLALALVAVLRLAPPGSLPAALEALPLRRR